MTQDASYKPALELRDIGMHSNGSQSGTYYKIEVRNTSTMSKVIGDPESAIPFVIDNYWRELPITLGATKWGVNIPIRRWDSEVASHGLLSYVAAEAHRWAFLAALEAGTIGGALCVETRLVAVEYSQSFTTKELGVSETASHSFRPPSISPRTATKPAAAKSNAA